MATPGTASQTVVALGTYTAIGCTFFLLYIRIYILILAQPLINVMANATKQYYMIYEEKRDARNKEIKKNRFIFSFLERTLF